MKNSREVSYFPWGVSDASSCHDGKLDKRMKKTKNLTFLIKFNVYEDRRNCIVKRLSLLMTREIKLLECIPA